MMKVPGLKGSQEVSRCPMATSYQELRTSLAESMGSAPEIGDGLKDSQWDTISAITNDLIPVPLSDWFKLL